MTKSRSRQISSCGRDDDVNATRLFHVRRGLASIIVCKLPVVEQRDDQFAAECGEKSI